MADTLIEQLEDYYDTVPRAASDPADEGPFTLFRPTGDWGYYARPRRDADATYDSDDVRRVRDRMREMGMNGAIEWVHEKTPTLLPAAREAGLDIAECPMLVLDGDVITPGDVPGSVGLVPADDERFGAVHRAIYAGFGGVDDPDQAESGPISDWLLSMHRDGHVRMVGAFDADGRAVGGGSHSPRGRVTELIGIAVLPSRRRAGYGAAITAALAGDARGVGVETVFLSAGSDAVARVYERVGFVRVGTACIVEGG